MMAIPHVGDEAEYSVGFDQDDVQMRRVIVKVDLTQDKCVTNTTDHGILTNETMKCSVIDDATYSSDACKAMGGEEGEVNGPAGHFDPACMLYSKRFTDFVFYGHVPFRLIYFEKKDPATGRTPIIQLHEYHFAQ